MTADKYIGAELWALVPVSLMSSPNGRYLREIKPNNYIGTIYSYVQNNGVLWWQLDDREGQFKGYVQHDENKFDKTKIEKTLSELKAKEKKELDEAVEKRKKENSLFNFSSNLLEDFEDVFKWVMILIVLLVVLNLTKK